MKRFLALALAAMLLLGSAAAQSGMTQDLQSGGVTIWRNHQETDDQQQVVFDYPTFETDDAGLAAFLEENVTQPIRALCDPQSASIRGGYYASADFEGILSVEASVRAQAADGEEEAIRLFSALVDLNARRLLTLADLFNEPAAVVEEVVCNAVYAAAQKMNLAFESGITDSGFVPLPDSIFLTKNALRTLYAPGTLCPYAATVDVRWEDMPLTFSPVMLGEASVGVIGGADGPTSIFIAEGAQDVPQEILAAVTLEPLPLVTAAATPEPQITPAPAATLDPNFSLAPVATPTPMPLNVNDSVMVDVLTHGLWKPLGGEGDVYYQFTADGKLLTVKVSQYTVEDGVLSSDALNGAVDIGSDSAFTLNTNGVLSGYVLNRQGERVAPEEFVTPSPTPAPTPTPSPTPAPTPTPVPSPTATPLPTATPTPTLSPFLRAKQQAPEMFFAENVSFEKARTFKVYSAPGETTWSVEGAQVTTDESVAIYGLDNGWLLVSYAIGNGTRGRIGYIESSTLADPQNVPQLPFISMPITLTQDAEGTDDPLRGQGAITTLKAGEEVTLLAFLDRKWAYVQTSLEGRVCRLFIPQTALQD